MTSLSLLLFIGKKYERSTSRACAIFSSEVIASADYFSLRNINLGYNMPETVTSKLGLEGLRLYATAQNLLYITADDYHGFNPEHDDNGNPRAYGSQRAGTPIYKTISFGLNIDF